MTTLFHNQYVTIKAEWRWAGRSGEYIFGESLPTSGFASPPPPPPRPLFRVRSTLEVLSWSFTSQEYLAEWLLCGLYTCCHLLPTRGATLNSVLPPLPAPSDPQWTASATAQSGWVKATYRLCLLAAVWVILEGCHCVVLGVLITVQVINMLIYWDEEMVGSGNLLMNIW